MKKIISVLALLTILTCGFAYAEEVDTDKTIRVNKEVTDTIRSRDEVDYFYFDLSKQGSVQIEFEFDVKGKYYVRLHDVENDKEIQSKDFYTDYNTSSGTETFYADKLRLPAGEYRIKVTSSTEDSFREKYKLTVHYQQESKGSYEVENNNSAKDSIKIDTNDTITGNLQSNRDEDYYMFEAPYAGKLQLNLEYNYQGAYNVVLYKQSGTRLEEIQYNEAKTETKPYVGDYFSQNFNKIRVPAGTYYVKVSNRTYTNEDYNLTVLYNIERYGNFEVEDNNEIKDATEIYNNISYVGNLSSNRDTDYYFGYINKGELNLAFEVLDGATYSVEVSKEENGKLVTVTKKEIKSDDNSFETINVEKSGRYYFKVTSRNYSNEDYTIKFTNNIYTPIYQGTTTIDLQIGNMYMNVNGVGRLIDNNGTMPVLSSGRTMLPIRAVIEALGGTIDWDNDTFTTTLKIGTKNISIKVGDKVAYVNGTAKTLDVPAQLINQRTMLPLRFIMENLGGNVTWDDATQIVVIKY